MTVSVWSEIAAVASGGALGCVGRYAMEHLPLTADKPWTTVITNLIGCALIGIVSAILARYAAASSLWPRLLVTGLLGGFTTFSAFALHPVTLIRQGVWGEALLYVGISVTGGLALCGIALVFTEKILSRI